MTTRLRISLLLTTVLAHWAIAQVKVNIQGHPATVTASSTLKGKTPNQYTVANAFDGDSTTAWVEGDAGDGTGQFIRIKFESARVVKSIMVSNGYRKSKATFVENNRAATVDLTLDGKSSNLFAGISLASTTTLSVNKALMEITLTFSGVTKGTKYSDLCISDLKFDFAETASAPIAGDDYWIAGEKNWMLKAAGGKVMIFKANTKAGALFDTTYDKTGSILQTRLLRNKDVSVPGYTTLELTTQYEYERDSHLLLIQNSGACRVFFMWKSLGDEGSITYDFVSATPSAGNYRLTFSGECSYPECPSFQKKKVFTVPGGGN